MFAFTSFVGFESAALYGEETRNPERSIPGRPTSRCVTIGDLLRPDHLDHHRRGRWHPARRSWPSEQLGNFVFNLILDAGGTVLYDLAAVLFCTSCWPPLLALHNAASRYLFALGRERVLPSRARPATTPAPQPVLASLSRSPGCAAAAPRLAWRCSAPIRTPSSRPASSASARWASSLLQAAAALAVVVFFRRRAGPRPAGAASSRRSIGFIGLATGFTLAVTHYSTPDRLDATCWSTRCPPC